MTAAATALGTRLFGGYGEGAGKDKHAYNQVKKAADAISAYVMSEGLWHLTRTLPENHAIMVSLGEGLMPKAGETPEMGANPLLGFGRVYARPEVARTVDRRVRRLLNEPGHTFEQFHGWLKDRGITIWGAAVDTLENTSRFAEGKATGPMAVFHLFDSPLRVSKPYESYMGCLTVPRPVARGGRADRRPARLPDAAGPGGRGDRGHLPGHPSASNIHVWTLRGKSRVKRLGKLWEEWKAAGVPPGGGRLEGPLRPSRSSPTPAPTPPPSWWGAGRTPPARPHVFLCDGYAATAEAMQASSLSEVLDVDASMAMFSPTFDLPCDQEAKLMQLDPRAPDFAAQVRAHPRRQGPSRPSEVQAYAEAIDDARASNMPIGQPGAPRRRLPAGEGLAASSPAIGYMSDDPYTGAKGVEKVGEGRLQGHHAAGHPQRLGPHHLHLPLHGAARARPRHVFSPLLVRFLSGVDHTDAAGEDLRLGAHPQRAPDHALAGAGARRRADHGPLGPDRRAGHAAREAGGHPPGARVVQGEPPGLVRVAGGRLSR